MLFIGNLNRKATKNEEEDASKSSEYSKFDVFRIGAKSGLFYPLTMSLIILLGGIESFGEEMVYSIGRNLNTLLIIFFWSQFGRSLRDFLDKIPFVFFVPTFLAVMAWLGSKMNEHKTPHQ